MTGGAGAARRTPGVAFFGAVVALTDLLPPRIRYGYVHALTARLFGMPLAAVAAIDPAVPAPTPLHASGAETSTRVALVTDDLDVGGIGTVIEMLALGFAGEGVEAIVLCPRDGRRAARLREAGVQVEHATDADTARAAMARILPDVIEVHSAPAYLERASLAAGVPLVTAMHNTEIHFTRARWTAFRRLLGGSASGIAVSDTVRDYHARHVPAELTARIAVVPNGAPAPVAADPHRRERARAAVGAAVGMPLADDVVFVTLARYDAQKNVAGTVASFLAAAETHPELRLVYAGDPSDWAELRRADAIRRAHPQGHRVHLLGNSDAATLLAAADAFLLDSFFEGWAVAATEAAAAGLPLVLSDVGGARELVARDVDRSVLVANATGAASEVSDARVRVARRRSRAQINRAEVVRGITATADIVRRGHPAPEPAEDADVGAMVRAHAGLLRAAAQQR